MRFATGPIATAPEKPSCLRFIKDAIGFLNDENILRYVANAPPPVPSTTSHRESVRQRPWGGGRKLLLIGHSLETPLTDSLSFLNTS
jgi:hypothetical protein